MKKPIAFVYPGQGSQAIGMGQFLYNRFSLARDYFERASEILNLDIKKLCFTGDEKELSLTENTQPCLLTVSTITSSILNTEFGLFPEVTAGHSIGEYASFVLSGVLSFEEALKAVRFRGQAMQSAVPVGKGGMTACLGLTEQQVQFICRWTENESKHSPISAANYNCDGQIVLSGDLQALNWLKENMAHVPWDLNGLDKPNRAKLIPLQVSAPFHCQLMKPAEEKMAELLNTFQFKSPKIPIYQNFSAQKETDVQILKTQLIRQISAPVLWTQTMSQMKKEGFHTIFECGHGSVLKGLFKKSDADLFKVFTTQSDEDLNLIEAVQKQSS